MNSDAEILIAIADVIMHPRERLVLSDDNPAHAVDLVALGLKLRKNPGLALRALVEKWDRVRIVRELH